MVVHRTRCPSPPSPATRQHTKRTFCASQALGLLYSVVLYPTLTVLVVTIRKWKDDGWEANKKVYISMGICFGVMLIFVVLTIFAYKPIR